MFFFFFQAEDGIRDYKVTGVQTCALPILVPQTASRPGQAARDALDHALGRLAPGVAHLPGLQPQVHQAHQSPRPWTVTWRDTLGSTTPPSLSRGPGALAYPRGQGCLPAPSGMVYSRKL